MRTKLIPLLIGAGLGILARLSLADESPLELKSSATMTPVGKSRRPESVLDPGVSLRLAESLSIRGMRMPPADPAQAELLNQARLWQSRNRDDLVLEVLNKLLSIAPDQPDGLAQLAFLHLRNNEKDKAKQALEKLRRVQPSHPDIQRIETLIRLDGVDKERLRQARNLAHAGKTKEALAALRALYPGGPPTSDLALEYWLLVGDTANGWDRALAGLRQLNKEYPDNLRYRLALAEHITTRYPADSAALQTIKELAKMPPFDRPAKVAWRHAMLRLEPAPSNVALVKQYLEGEEVEDTGVKEHLANMQRAIEEHRRLMADPYYRAKLDGLLRLDGGRLEEAEDKLLFAWQGRPADPDLLGGLGLLRMRQGHHAEAQAYFLQAQQRDPNPERWKGLLRAARYWGLMREASDAEDAKEFTLAEHKLEEARILDPYEPEALAALGRIRVAQNRTAEAEAAFRDALRLQPANVSALRGLANLLLRAGREQEIDAMLARLGKAQRKEIGDAIDTARAAIYKEKAEALLANGNTAQAVAMLEHAAAIDRNDPWLRYDLARLYAVQGDAHKGDNLFKELLARRPDDAAARYAYALTLARQDQRTEALTTLERVAEGNRDAEMTDLQRRLWISAAVQSAQSLIKNNRIAAAKRLLDDAQHSAGNDPLLLIEIADARIDAGDIEHAHTMLAHMAEIDPPSAGWAMRHARLLAAAAGDDMVASLLTRIEKMQLDAEQKTALGELKLDLALREAENLRRRNHTAEALQRITPYLAIYPQNERLLATQARYLRALQMPEKAADAYRRITALNSKNRDAAIGLIEVLIESGQHGEARALLNAQLAEPDGITPDQSADLIAALIDLGDDEAAQQLADSSLESAPDNPRLLAYAGQIARRMGRLDVAIDFLQRSLAREAEQHPLDVPRVSMLRLAAAKDDRSPPLLEVVPAAKAASESNAGTYRRIADMLDRKTTWLGTAVDKHMRSGSPGTSDYSLTEIPLEWKQPQTRDGRWTYRADIVAVSAGDLDLAASGQTFGSALLCQPACGSGLLPQYARGIALNAMLERDNMRYDLGTTPLGFPVQSLVGGVLRKGDIGPFGYSLDISRRPLTGSLLSYAGTRDPRTGQVWGGVQATGIRLGLSLDDGGTYGGWSSFGLHKLTGRNVLPNNRMQLMAGAVVRVINEDDRLLQFGVTGMHWRLSENAGEYTFGHGGYYSPESFTSLSLPVTWGQRFARLAYAVRASISASRSQTKDASYFPTNPAMQAEAERLAASTGVTPFYTGGPGSGVGRSLALSWEYQSDLRLFLGGRAEMDRSADYSPNRFVFYLRYAFDRLSARPVAFLPEPVNPTSQY